MYANTEKTRTGDLVGLVHDDRRDGNRLSSRGRGRRRVGVSGGAAAAAGEIKRLVAATGKTTHKTVIGKDQRKRRQYARYMDSQSNYAHAV